MGSFDKFLRFFNFFVSVSYPALVFELNIDVLVSGTHIVSVNLVRGYRFFEISLKIDEYELKYHWYARAQYY